MKEKLIRVKNGIDKFFNSDWFVVVFTAIVLLSWTLEVEYIAVGAGIITLMYMFLTQQYLDRIALVAIVIPAFVDNNMRHRIDLKFIIIVVALLLLVAGCGVYYFIKNRNTEKRKLKNSKFLLVYLLAILAVALGGIGYPGQTFVKALIIIGLHGALLGLYILLYKCGSENLKDTVMKSVIALAGVIVAEMIIYFIRVDDALFSITYKQMSLGWAITNSVAVMLAFAIPFCFYLARKKKVQLPYMLLGTLYYFFIFLTNCRSMMLVGTGVYLICLVLSFVYNNWWQALINTGVLVVLVVLATTVLRESIFNRFITYGLDGTGREEQWAYYWDKFKENKMFGMGFMTDETYRDGIVRAHSTPLQILVSMGIIGAICAIPYYFVRYKVFINRPTIFKLFAFVCYIAMVGYGLVDCALISSYKLIAVYMLMTAVELDDETKEPLFLKQPNNKFILNRK